MKHNLEDVMAPVARALVQLSKTENDLAGWEIVGLTRIGEQRLADGGPENSLRLMQSRHGIEEQTLSVQVYVTPSSAMMGTAGATLDPMGSPLEEQLAAILPAARGGTNPRWQLPDPIPPSGAQPQPLLCDKDFQKNPSPFVDELLRQADRHCRALQGARVESAELYGDLITRRVLTSTGLDWTETTSEFYFEAAFEAHPPRVPYNTQEIHEAVRSVCGSGLNLEDFIRRCGQSATRLGQTVMAPSRENAVTLLGADALAQLFHALLGHLDLGTQYYRRPHLTEGQLVCEGAPRGDALHLSLDPFLDYMAESATRTRDGLPTRAQSLVEQGKVVARTGSHRMAQYLGVPTPGVCGNLVVSPGAKTKSELLKAHPEVFEIEAFSSLLISGDTLTWSSEVGRGLLHRNGTTQAIKGGVMSGHLKKNLAAALFSSELATYNRTADAYHSAIGYRGPAWALFTDGVSISGQKV